MNIAKATSYNPDITSSKPQNWTSHIMWYISDIAQPLINKLFNISPSTLTKLSDSLHNVLIIKLVLIEWDLWSLLATYPNNPC